MLRTCFGDGVDASKLTTKFNGDMEKMVKWNGRKRGSLATSTRASVAFIKGSTSYISKVRCGVAQYLVERGQNQVNTALVARPMHCVFVVSIDCTTECVKVGTVMGPHTTMIILASVFTRQSQEQVLDTKLLVPTQVIHDETAEGLHAGMRRGLPSLALPCREVAEKDRVLILNTDSHKANKRLYRHFCCVADTLEWMWVLHSFCVMHMVCASLVAVLSSFDLINGAFCAALQIHKGTTMKGIREYVHAFIDAHLQVEHEWDPSWDRVTSLLL